MLICSDYYYRASLKDGNYKITHNPNNPNDTRFHPARSFEVFPVWLQYISKFFPDESIIFFDNFSPIPIEKALNNFELIPEKSLSYNKENKYHVKKFDKEFFYFHAVQRQKVEAIKMAYYNNEDLLWIDTDCLINSDLKPHIEGYDVFSPIIAHDTMVMDAHCVYLSKERLHEWDSEYHLPEFLDYILNYAPDDNQGVRHMILFEGGFYKLFCYGNYNSCNNLNYVHASCYNNFLKWLKLNPLKTKEYNNLVNLLENIDREKLNGVLLDFHDDYHIRND